MALEGVPMKTILRNATVFTRKGFEKMDIAISGDRLLVPFDVSDIVQSDDVVFDFNHKYILPGFVDVHVHFREPGFSYKETIGTGSMAAAHGGFTTVFTMPNLNPPPCDYASLKQQLDIIVKDAVIKVVPFGAITENQKGRGMLSKMDEMADYVAGFSDDGVGVQADFTMEDAMVKVASLGKIISAHCEDESLNTIPYTGTTSASESVQAARDIELSAKTGCKYHICHVSAKETLDAVRSGKARGIDVTCETGPHYIAFNTNTIKHEGNFRMNPPIKSPEDQKAIIEAIKDGTIDMIATDHAPHSLEEKSRGFDKSSFGVVGLETSFAAVVTHVLKPGILSIDDIVNLMSTKPAQLIGVDAGVLEVGKPADISVLSLDETWTVDRNQFYTRGKSCPFDGMTLQGKAKLTVVDGQIVMKDGVVTE